MSDPAAAEAAPWRWPESIAAARRVFVLSLASCGGERAQFVFDEHARFDLARRLRTRGGAPLGEVLSFLSGLYFRGKLAYALRFACPPVGVPGVLVITPCQGFKPPATCVDLGLLRRYAAVSINAANAAYRRPLVRDARELAAALRGAPPCEVVAGQRRDRQARRAAGPGVGRAARVPT